MAPYTITKKDFSTDDFDNLLEHFDLFCRSSIYTNSDLPINATKTIYHLNRLALSYTHKKLKETTKTVCDVYAEKLLELTELKELIEMPNGHQAFFNLSDNAYKSTVLLFSLMCKLPFVEDENEKSVLKEKIDMAKHLHSKDLKNLRKIINNPERKLCDKDGKVLEKSGILKLPYDANSLYSKLESIVANAKVLKEFMEINKVPTINDIHMFNLRAQTEMQAMKRSSPLILVGQFSYALNKSQIWFMENVKFPDKNKTFILNRLAVDPRLNHSPSNQQTSYTPHEK
ncbi:MAG: hypothetical protein J6K39_00130 [Clostridia bacterium]|nr:hypothetical protein [Clostridia bacterium]